MSNSDPDQNNHTEFIQSKQNYQDSSTKNTSISIEMDKIDKSEYKELPSNLIVNELRSSRSSSESSIIIAPPIENPYLKPSIDLNGRISYLQDLEDLPQGRHLGLFSTIILFVSRILGSGIFSITSGIYKDCGQSIYLFFLAWFIACVASFGGLYVFLEFGSIVPRSGGAKVFLEFIYTKPKLLATVAFSVYSVIFGFTISNVLVFGEYCIHALGIETSDFKTRLTGLLFLYITAIVHGFSVNHGVKIQNILGGLKLGLVVIMVLSGLYVFLPQSINNIESQISLNDVFKTRKEVSISTFSSAVIKASFAFSGWNSVHTVSNEIKDPIRTFKIAGPVSLIIMTITYFIINLAYLIVIPDEELANSSTLAGSILFEKLFGVILGKQLLTLSIALCAGGNIFVVLYTISRVDQGVFREGYLPFSKFMSSNWPNGGPLRTMILSCSITTFIIVVFPHGDIYSYMVSLEGFPMSVATGLVAIGIFIVRKKYPNLNPPIKAGAIGTVLVIIINMYLTVGPFVSKYSPNPKGLENWPNYGVVGLVCILFCILFWYFKFELLPWLGNYKLVAEEEKLSDGLTIKNWVKIHRGV